MGFNSGFKVLIYLCIQSTVILGTAQNGIVERTKKQWRDQCGMLMRHIQHKHFSLCGLQDKRVHRFTAAETNASCKWLIRAVCFRHRSPAQRLRHEQPYRETPQSTRIPVSGKVKLSLSLFTSEGHS
jgi:hypothetical protein